MVDIYRLWVLWTLAGRLPPGDILEVGSWRGGSGAVIATAAGGSARNVFLADTFAGVVKAGERDPYYRGGEHSNTSPETVRGLLNDLDLPDVRLLVGIFPEETGQEIGDRRFALAHIDVDVYQSAIDAFEWVWSRLVPGGVVVFDDYGFYGCEGVTACVDEVAASRPEAVLVPNLSGQAIMVNVAS
jgi:O-methyltransferase